MDQAIVALRRCARAFQASQLASQTARAQLLPRDLPQVPILSALDRHFAQNFGTQVGDNHSAPLNPKLQIRYPERSKEEPQMTVRPRVPGQNRRSFLLRMILLSGALSVGLATLSLFGQ